MRSLSERSGRRNIAGSLHRTSGRAAAGEEATDGLVERGGALVVGVGLERAPLAVAGDARGLRRVGQQPLDLLDALVERTVGDDVVAAEELPEVLFVIRDEAGARAGRLEDA